MAAHKRIDTICIAVTIFIIVLTAFLLSARALGIVPAVSEAAASGLFTANDLNGDWDTSSATKIVLSDKDSRISGNGAYVYDGDVYIAYAGHYVLTGELTDGSVIVDAGKSDKIWISLDGVTLHCDDAAAIRVEQAGKVFLTLAEGTENTISSGAQYNEEATAAGVDGTIYSRDDLTINGTGSLVVNAEYYHGIVCNDDLVITGGNITISAVQDGIHANDSVCIRSSVISISAGDDGITVSNDDETAFLYVESGNISIPACYEGLEAIAVTITGGTIDIMPTDDGINANGSGTSSVIRITGGDITIKNPSGRDADGLDSNGSIYIEGGRVFISVADSGRNYALDYGSENGGECVVSGGIVIACGSSAMAEGFDSGSPQGFLMYNATAGAGTTIVLEDSLGRELLSEEIPLDFSSVVLSSPDLKVGDVCTLVIGDTREQIIIDNSSSSGFNPGGMFGGGMPGGRGHGGAFGGHANASASSERPDFLDGISSFNGMELPGGMGSPDGMEPPEGMGSPDGMEPPGGMDSPDGMEPPGSMGSPDDVRPSDGGNISTGEGESDGSELQEVSGRPFTPGERQPQGDDIHSQQRDWGQTNPQETVSVSNVSADTLILLGISVLALMIGLFIALKIKH